MGAIDPNKLAAVSGRTTDVILRVPNGSAPPSNSANEPAQTPTLRCYPPRPQSWDVPARDRAQTPRRPAHRGSGSRLTRPAGPQGNPDRGRPSLGDLTTHIDAFLAASPAASAREIWEHLLNDHHAAPSPTPAAEAAGYFPGPFAVLRTLKSDVVVGVSAPRLTELDTAHPQWRTNGTHATIHTVR